MGALTGIKVVELAHFIAGPFCGQILGDHGAEVIRVETHNDINHQMNPWYKDVSIYYPALHRNKKSIVLDLKSEEGREVLHRLIAEADVLLTNYSAGVPERLGFGYEQVSKINPLIIMTHITGFGLTGPLREKGAYDPIVQGMSGINHLTGDPDGPPMNVGIYIADHLAGVQGALGTSLALNARNRTGKGQLVDVSMLDSLVTFLFYHFSDVKLNNHHPKRTGNSIARTVSGIYPTADGYITAAPMTNAMWDGMCDLMGRWEWKSENADYSDNFKRVARYAELENGIIEWTRQHSTEDALRLLEDKGVPCGPINTIQDVMNTPQLIERDMIISAKVPGYEEILAPGIPIKLSGTPAPDIAPPPWLSQHSEEILRGLGYSEEQIQNFYAKNVTALYKEQNAAT